MAVVGGLTFRQMRDELDLIISNTWGDGERLVGADLIGQWINLGYQELDRKLRWTRCEYVFPTVAEEEEYIIPCQVREVLAVTYTTASGTMRRLTELDFDSWIDARVGSDEAGDPEQFLHHGDRFYLYPKPLTADEVVTLYIVTEPPNLEEDDDRPGFPAHLHSRIIDLAFAKALRFFSRYVDAANLEAHVDSQLALEKKMPAVHRDGRGKAKTARL